MRPSHWRENGIGVVRILFGGAWLMGAQFKWRPAFIDDLSSYLSGALTGQPALALILGLRFLTRAGPFPGLDFWLGDRLGRVAFLASGPNRAGRTP